MWKCCSLVVRLESGQLRLSGLKSYRTGLSLCTYSSEYGFGGGSQLVSIVPGLLRHSFLLWRLWL